VCARYFPIEQIADLELTSAQFMPPAAMGDHGQVFEGTIPSHVAEPRDVVKVLLAEAGWKEAPFRRLMSDLCNSLNSANTVADICDAHGLEKKKWLTDCEGRYFHLRATGLRFDDSANIVKAKFGPPKSAARALVKWTEAVEEWLMSEEVNTGLKDLNRVSFEFQDPLAMALTFECLKNHKEIKVVGVKNKFKLDNRQKTYTEPPNIHVNVDIGGGWLCEVEFLFKDILLIKKELHKFYDVRRANGPWTVATPLFNKPPETTMQKRLPSART